jgi:hypothetical protein
MVQWSHRLRTGIGIVSDHIQEPRADKSQSPIAYLKAVDVGETTV